MDRDNETEDVIHRRRELLHELGALEAMSSYEQVSSAAGAIHQLMIAWIKVGELDELAPREKFEESDAARAAARRLLSSVIAYLEQISGVSSLEIGRKYSGL
jgi:hypothetical protein